jgi:hypothetical protein
VRDLLAAAGRGDLADRAGAVERLVALGLEHPEVRAAVRKLLASPGKEARILALDALPPTGEAEIVEAAARSLRHGAWQVRAAAAEALGRGRAKAAIPPLIAQLGTERHVRARRAVAAALHRITGLGFADYADVWRRWWREQGDAFVVPADPPEPRAPAAGERRTVATFYGVAVEENAVVFVLDRSASMLQRDAAGGRSRFDVAVGEVVGAVGKLGKGVRVNVIVFGTDVWRWRKAMTPWQGATPAELAADLARLSPEGGTYLYDALETALAEEEVEAIYLLSDGEPSGGKFTDAARILAEVGARNRFTRATIHCVAVGLDSWLLKQLAARHGGSYVRK